MSAKEITRASTVCFSGHRTEKLPDNGDENSPVIKVVKSMLYKAVADSIDDGCNCFVTGLARGIDLWAGQIVLDLKAQGADIDLVAAYPYRAHGLSFKGRDKWLFGNIISKASEIVYVNEEYSKFCMKQRNEYMISRSGKLIAVVCSYKSGTGQTIRLAKNAGLDTVIIDAAKIAASLDENQLTF